MRVRKEKGREGSKKVQKRGTKWECFDARAIDMSMFRL